MERAYNKERLYVKKIALKIDLKAPNIITKSKKYKLSKVQNQK